VRQAFDYVIVQLVPRVERGERLNLGAIVFCPSAGYLGCLMAGDELELELELRAFPLANALDLPAVRRQLEAIRAVCAGAPTAGPIARLSRSERFHWLSAPRSTVVQPSAAHAGLCDDPALALARVFEAEVARSSPATRAGPSSA
jgi:hypothetical protein